MIRLPPRFRNISMKNRVDSLLAAYLFAVFVALVVAQLTQSAQSMQWVVARQLAPLQSTGVTVTQQLNQATDSFFSYFHTAKDMATLRYELSQQEAKLAELDQLRTENAQLREALGLAEKQTNVRRIVALPILSYPYRLVEIGSDTGAQVGQLVLVDGTLVGRLTEVSPAISRVTILSDRSSTPIVATTNLGQRGVIRGTGSSVLFTEVAQTSTVSVGDRILTAGQADMPSGLFIGTVRSEITEPTDGVRTFVVEQVQSFDTAQVVAIE